VERAASVDTLGGYDPPAAVPADPPADDAVLAPPAGVVHAEIPAAAARAAETNVVPVAILAVIHGEPPALAAASRRS